jgi:hypothetical protein
MYSIKKFANLSNHQSLLNKVAKVVCEDSRVAGLYVYGSPEANEYSDIDIKIFFRTEEERDSFRDEIEEITQKIGKIKMGSIYPPENVMYLVIFDPEEIKVDISFTIIYKDGNPYEYPVDIIHDPEGHLEKMINEAPKLVVDIDKTDLDRRVKTFYVGFNYLMSKMGGGSLWSVFDVIDIYRRAIIEVEDIFAQRLQKGYLEVEKNLDEERIAILKNTLISELTQENLFKAMDAIIEYWDRFLLGKIKEMGLFPEESASSMMEFYERKKTEILG